MGPVDGHPADGVHEHDIVHDRLDGGQRRAARPRERRRTRRRDERRRAAPHLHQLAEDRDRDLLGRLGAEVEARRRAKRREPLVRDLALVPEPCPDMLRPGRRRHEPDVGHVRTPERAPERLLVPDPLGRDDDVRRRLRLEHREPGLVQHAFRAGERGLVRLRVEHGHAPAGGPAQGGERADDRGRAGEPQLGGGNVRFHVDLQGPAGVAGHDQLHDRRRRGVPRPVPSSTAGAAGAARRRAPGAPPGRRPAGRSCRRPSPRSCRPGG